jgi:hypothetical protein
MLIKGDDNHYTVVLTDFDGGFCKTKIRNNIEYNENDKQMIYHLILLLLFLSSRLIVNENIKQCNYDNDLDIIEKLNLLYPVYYDELVSFFEQQKTVFFDFLSKNLNIDVNNDENNKIVNIILEILRLIDKLNLRSHTKFHNHKPFIIHAIMVGIKNNKDYFIEIIKNLINNCLLLEPEKLENA